MMLKNSKATGASLGALVPFGPGRLYACLKPLRVSAYTGGDPSRALFWQRLRPGGKGSNPAD